MKLTKLESFLVLEGGRLKGMKQADLEWTLRSLYPERIAPASFLPTIRQLKFKSRESGASSVGHGDATVDIEIEQQLTGSQNEIDQEVTLETFVFDELAAMSGAPLVKIKCAVLVNMAEKTFTLKPLEGQVAAALREVREFLASRIINADDIPANVKVFIDAAR